MSSCTDMSAVVDARPIPTPTETAIPWLLQSDLSPDFPSLTELPFPIPVSAASHGMDTPTQPATPPRPGSARRPGALAAALLFFGVAVGVITAHAATLQSRDAVASRSVTFPAPAYLAPSSTDDTPAARFELGDDARADTSASSGAAASPPTSGRTQRAKSRKADAPLRRATPETLAALLSADSRAHRASGVPRSCVEIRDTRCPISLQGR